MGSGLMHQMLPKVGNKMGNVSLYFLQVRKTVQDCCNRAQGTFLMMNGHVASLAISCLMIRSASSCTCVLVPLASTARTSVSSCVGVSKLSN